MLIRLEEIGKIYDAGEVKVRALSQINLRIRPGEFVAIIGQSGSGKTTLLDILGCLRRPTEGEYWFNEKRISSLSDHELTNIRNQQIGFVFQTFHLLPRKTALENVQLPLQYAGTSGKEQRSQARAMLNRVGLSDRAKHYPTQLSCGQQQRVAIARALVNQPALLLADEPTGNLDSRTGQDILSMVQSLHQQGQTIVMITHDRDVAMTAERRVTLSDGRIVSDESNPAPMLVATEEARRR